MCGIIGYIGLKKASEIILQALIALEYRGYDSVGLAVFNKGKINLKKDAGKVKDIAQTLSFTSLEGSLGIGHTRWATHGKVCKENAHPHSDCSGDSVIVHNGVIENYVELKKELAKKGHEFKSETDSEVIAHLLEENLKSLNFEKAFIQTVKQLEGSYAILAMTNKEKKIAGAKKNNPLILGLGDQEFILTSDISALLPYTKKTISLEDERIVFASDNFRILDLNGKETDYEIKEITWDVESAERSGFKHFMLKEIYEQESIIYQSLGTDVQNAKKIIENAKNIHIIACGTSYYASKILDIFLEKKMKKNSKAFIASEYSIIASPKENDLIIAISQSGETADAIQAIKFAKQKGAKILSLINIMDSSIARISDSVIYLHAGLEMGVAATKTFSAQLAIIYKLTYGENIQEIPGLLKRARLLEDKIKKIAEQIRDSEHVFFIARGLCYPLAMEGALKLKELSYIHSEAYPGGELKHGPLSLVTQGTLIIALAPNDETYRKMHGNIKEVKARGGFVIALSDNESLRNDVDIFVKIEKTKPVLYPFAIIPILQLLAYHISILKGLDPDKPRNLAKSVTVE